ncbi:MAG: hypothetical protein UY58_C0002G0001 [Candidatus Magasanikbacteria bacterium GW2011_GWA2_50_22]|uniref:DUF1003 domain-containing protein n=1 Tax=Candidatus Magasanikbacteria bacterium GW2011_GWA2_50_22 TaxID=1619043 RepID=A0A0G1WFU7_9BACT|nr:MAG: hypothetical protein UY58_C0002G0001 [Candidatus Magasanikbacteria bacterium GW2011_GWA2_50_22]
MSVKSSDPSAAGAQGNQHETVSEVSARRARHKIIRSVEARLNKRRALSEKFADALVSMLGNIKAIVAHAVIFIFWIAINTGLVLGIKPFDPFPFNFLTMIVSLEAIFLSIFVLISQNRESKISDLREEIDIQVNMIAEQEITKIIHLLASLMKHLKVPYEQDPELKRMMQPLNTDEIEKELERQLNLPHL